jgi:hypothetical protein
MKHAFLIPLFCLVFGSCGKPTPIDLPVTPQEQSLYQSIEERMPLDSLDRYTYRYMNLCYPIVSHIGYYVELYASADSLEQTVKEDIAKSVLEFVMSKPKPFKKGRVTRCIIYFYRRGERYSDEAFMYGINGNEYKKYGERTDNE